METKESKDRMKRLVLRCRNRDLVNAIQAWNAIVKAELSEKSDMKRALARLFLKALHSSYSMWHDGIVAYKKVMHRQQVLCYRIMNRELVACWKFWVAEGREASRQLGFIKKMSKRLLNRALSGAYQSWNEPGGGSSSHP